MQYSHKMMWLVFKILKHSHKTMWLAFKIAKYGHKMLIGFFFDGCSLNDCFLNSSFFDGCFCFRDFWVALTLFLLTLNKSVNFSSIAKWGYQDNFKSFRSHKKHQHVKQTTFTLFEVCAHKIVAFVVYNFSWQHKT